MYPLKKLSEICKILKGKNPNLFPSFKDGSKPYLSAKYIRGTQLPEYALEADSKSILVEKDDIVIICDGSNSGESFSGIEGILSSTMGKVLFKDEIDRKYLKFFLDLIIEELRGKKTGTAIPHLDIKGLLGYNIPLPSLSVQLDIVARLDSAIAEIDTLRNETESALASTRELWESYLDNLEGKKISLGSLVDIRTGKLNANAMKEDGIYPFFTCAKEIYKIDNFAFDCEAILLAGNNAVGDFNVKHYKGKFNAYQRTYVITVNEQNRVLYRYLYFQLVKSLDEFKKKSVGAGTKFLKLGMIQDMEIICPSLIEQSRIVAHLDAVRAETERLEILYTEKLTSLDELKKSILQEAFS